MPSTTGKSSLRAGMVASSPFLVIGFPFAVLFGVVATEAGLDVLQTLSMSILVIAGASQFTAMQLMTDNAPVWIVMTAALTVNLRMAMYSASLQPHLGAAALWQRILVAYLNVDGSYALSILKYESEPNLGLSDKLAYFFGTMVLMTPMWFIGTYVGAVAGQALPENLAVDFAMPILFLAMVGPMLKALAHVAAAVTSVVAVLTLSFLPTGIGLMLAGLLAMAVGAEVERRMGR